MLGENLGLRLYGDISVMDHRARNKLYKVCINDDPGLTITYFPARRLCVYMGKTV